MPQAAAFISYAHRYRDWVAALHKNLERCLEEHGDSRRVFLDQVDLASGRSWVAQLQAGLEQAEHLVLVATPESLASPRVADEWESFISCRRFWREGHLHVVRLVDCPVPTFLSTVQHLDFRGHDESTYRGALRRLLAGILGREARDLPELVDNLKIPEPPRSTLPTRLRRRLVAWLAPAMESKKDRRYLAVTTGLERLALDGHPAAEGAASALLALATGDDDALAAALRVSGIVADELDEDEDPARLAKLTEIRAALEKQRRGAGETGLVGAWLDQLARDHERLVPYFQQRQELDLLDKVYVQLELRHGSRPAELGEAMAKGRPHEAWTIRELLELDPAEHPWVTRRWVVLGDPGAGKTTLLRHLAASLARSGTPSFIPVLESLPRLMREPQWLLDRIERALRRAGVAAEGLAAALERAGQEGRLLVLLDGLDEVPREDRDDAEALLRLIAARWPLSGVIVTSRQIGYRRPDGDFQELELLPFDSARRREFLTRWFGRTGTAEAPARAEAAARTLERDVSLRELAGNPLYLTLMALLIEKGTAPERNRPRLYDQVFQLLLSGAHRPAGEPMEHPQAVRAVLRHVADAMTRANRDAEAVEQLEARLYQPELDPLRETLERVPRWRRGLRPFLDDLAERTGILGPHDGPQADWRFWHRTFREALAAEALEEEMQAGGENALADRARQISGDEGRWAEPYALLAGRVDDPDALIRALVETNRPLGLRAVATAQGLCDETLYEVLELAAERGAWEDRAKVYARIPELVDDPARVLALLDQLRGRMRNGNDLFFLERAVADAATKWPDVERLAAQLRERFYDHIPAPPEELFRWVETRDGRVELWREISAGSFLMGGTMFDDEKPQHPVTVKSPFLMAAVPVTNAQFSAFDSGFEPYPWKGVAAEDLPNHPAVRITWYEAIAFCRWLSTALQRTSGARLPTEEEWEYACRAGTKTRYWSGDSEEDLARVGWYDANSTGRAHRVGKLPAGPWGLYDMHGNVWEWTSSPWSDDYSGREAGIEIDPQLTEPADPAAGGSGRRVARGGSYWDDAVGTRSAYRSRRDPEAEFQDRGFRVVLPLSAAPSS